MVVSELLRPFRAPTYVLIGCFLLAGSAGVRSQTTTRPKPDQPPQAAAPIAAPEPSPTAAPSEETPPSAAWPPGLLMEGLDKIGAKPALDNLSLRIYGVEEVGFTGKLHNKQKTPLFGRVFDTYRSDNIQPDQLRLILERPYDSSKSFDVGGRFEMLYGSDAHITKNTFPGATEYAVPENVGEGFGANWLDFLQMYGQLWFKTGKESGLEATIGKWATPMGAEVIAAEGNALYSHSYLFGFAEPFTHTGVKLNYIWNSQWSTYVALVNGWDVFEDNNHAHSYMTGGGWSSRAKVGNNARDQVFLNMMTGPEQTDDVSHYRTLVDAVWTHRWTEKLSTTLTGDYGTDEAGTPPSTRGHRANWYGLAHYVTYVFCPKVSATWRTEWFKDEQGVRIGTPGNCLENTVGLNLTPWDRHPILKNLSIRPELRWDHSCEEAVFAGEKNQMTAAFDVIYKF